jgi:hypothetical protein
MDDYLALRAVSSGLLYKLGVSSPLHAWTDSPWNPERKQDSSKAANVGTVVHSAILEENFDCAAVIDPRDHPAEKTGNIPEGWTNKSICAARDAAIDEGKIPILAGDMAHVESMVESTREYIARSDYADILSKGVAEATITWDDANNLPCKARPDWLRDDLCLHLKTTQMSVNPRLFQRTAINLGYDISLQWYERATGVPQIILAIEQSTPYACKFFTLSAAQKEIADRKIDRALALWRHCIATKSFPSYSGSAHEIEPTGWMLAQAEAELNLPMVDDEFFAGTLPL